MNSLELLRKVNLFLVEVRCNDREKQEHYITGHLSNDEVNSLDSILEHYGKDYTCDFGELQQQVHKDTETDLFEIK